MYDDHEHLDRELVRLERSLRGGDHTLACLQLAEFALKLDHYIRCEERALAARSEGVPHSGEWVEKIHREHMSLRRFVALIASALDRADDRRGVEVTGLLRSVLLLHVAKERWLDASLRQASVH
jgi:hypothetical protein